MNQLRLQSKRASLAEAVVNTLVGFCISVTAQYGFFHLYGIKATATQFINLSVAMTVLSVVRGYCLRRLWNAEWWKRIKYGQSNHP